MNAVENPPVRRLADWNYDQLRDLADQHGTPVYILDLDRIRQNYRRFAESFFDADTYYAVKANALHGVLQVLQQEGIGVECASAGEVHRSLDAGFDPTDILYTAVNPPAEDLDSVVDIEGVTITIGARDTADRLAERGYEGRLCVRVNTGVGAGHHEYVKTGGDAKFGIPADFASEVLTDLVNRGFIVVGIHAHAGSGISDDESSTHRALANQLSTIAMNSPVSLEFIDVGGGYGVPYHPEEAPIDLEQIAVETRDALAEVEARLAVEPGRYLVADAGVLLTRVNTVKSTHTSIIGVDAGMSTLLRPALYGAYHHIENLAPDASERETGVVTVTGPICESADVLGRDRSLPDPNRGDLLGIGNAGAYGYEMANQYNSRPRPPTIIIDGTRSCVAREREDISDLTNLEGVVPWL